MTPLLLALLACGSQRWAVKVAADPDAARIVLAPAPATVEELAALPAPAYGDSNPRAGPELHVYRVVAEVLGFKAEEDGDIHVVLRGASGQTMIAELPGEECLEASSLATPIRAARRQFLRYFMRPVGRYLRLRKPARVMVEGVFFFDHAHHQRGVAPNAGELHPVLHLELAESTVQGDQTTSPASTSRSAAHPAP